VSNDSSKDAPVAVTLRAIAKSYGSFEAVKRLDLDVRAGELFGLLGVNGAGKTTTIKMLMGILRPSAGTASIVGHDCFSARAEVMRHVGYLPDEPVFYDYLRGREIIQFVGAMHGLSKSDVTERARALIERLDLQDATEEFAVNYSKGMRKKLALLLALLHEPEVLILDEPTNGLDPYATRALHDLMQELTSRGRTIFFSTHLLDQAQRLCDRVAILHQGRLAALGTVDEISVDGARGGTLEEIFFSVTGEDRTSQRSEPYR
jgi:ABC-2 type transport system ATP-binding protein